MEPIEREQWQDKYSDPSKPQRSNVIPLNCLNEGLNKEQQEFSENQHQSEMSLMQARPLKGNTGPEDQQTMVKRMCEFALKNLNDPRCVQQFGNMMKSFTMSQLDHLNGEPEADAQDAVKHHHIELDQPIEEYEHRIEGPEHQIEEPEYPIEEPEYHIEEPEYHIEEPEQSMEEPQKLSDSRDQKTMSNLTKNLEQINCQGDQQISHKLEKTNEYQKLPSFLKEKRAPQISHNSDQSLVKESLMKGSLGTNYLQSRASYEEDKYDPSSSDSNTSESGSSDCSWKDSLYEPPPRTFDPDHLSDAHVFSEAEVFSDSYSDDTKECGYFKVSQVDNVLNSGSQEPNDSSENDSQPEVKEYSGIISLKMIKTTCKEIYLEVASESSSNSIDEEEAFESKSDLTQEKKESENSWDLISQKEVSDSSSDTIEEDKSLEKSSAQ
ncbi:unnamed protein product [Moneuplotes crassus]|uniref:Uncharacterized protein n=1 Tax=Euplotes crassus TaxID=5936 RepID=A0AAD1X5G4_EUPCR|nr:unnamed protein product [Moneuplotes crassus]